MAGHDPQRLIAHLASSIMTMASSSDALVYILRCADDTLYVGHTEDLASREQIHNDGKGAKYTAARRPVRMVYAEEHVSVAGAIARERQLKGWSNKKKEALILDDRVGLRSLGRRRTKSTPEVTWRDLLKTRG